ncbi:hypothetical protein GCK32_013498 [Trichostrongylus colubriformis]|uniref:Uncharacterized protein n=1 Tax=Trichostrongylus colubriformis TaxID=6319 RepID=A0AAN8F9N6_TRICO
MCASLGTLNTDTETSKNGFGAEDCDEEDFDIDELECVDEAAEEERRERIDHERGRRLREGRKRAEIPAKYRLDRFHPYPRRGREGFRGPRRRDTYLPHKRHSNDEHRKSSRNRSSHERSPRRHTRDSSHERSHRHHKRDNDEKDIPFEELEEVDCYDEVGDDSSEFTDGASRTGESHSGEDDDLGDTSIQPSVHGTSNDIDDDFPDLCEEIDVDAMRRAAAAASTNVLFADEHEPSELISSPPKQEVTKTNGVSYRGDEGKNGVSSRSYRTTVNGDGRDEARRHHRYVERHEHRSSRYSKDSRDSRTYRNGSRTRDDRHREKRASSREARPSTSGHSERQEKSTRDDAEIISVRGPLARGWCQVDEKEDVTSSLKPSSTSKSGSGGNITIRDSSSRKDAESKKRRSHSDGADTDTSTEGPTSYSKSSPLPKRTGSYMASPSTAKDSTFTHRSPKKRDQEEDRDSYRSPKHDIKSPQRKPSSNHQQQRNGTAISTKEKIPSLLDMCINGLESQQGPTTISLLDSVIRDSQFAKDTTQGDRYAGNGNENGRNSLKSRSLLDMEIPPPDRNVMRRYAIVLNSCELTKRQSNARSGNHNREVPSRSPLISSPRRNDRYERPRQPRAYAHGVRK